MTNKKQQQIDALLKQVLIMETQAAFDFLKSADASEEVINQVAMLLSPSDTRTAFLNDKGMLGELFNEQKNQDLTGVTIGNIKFIKPLGQGGMGAVYLAEDTTLQRKVAVKTLHNSHQINPAVQERFRREALILSKLDHPNICRIYHLIETEQADYLVLELIEGQTLSQSSIKQVSKSKKFAIAMSLLKALKTAHSKNIIHRDLKPENIMLDDKGQVKVLDFGISRLSTSPNMVKNLTDLPTPLTQHTVQGTVMGTLTYMSPEQAAGTEVTTASDIYTLGLVFQELFSQTPVYASDLTAEQILKFSTAAQTQTPTDLPHDLTQLIQRMKAKSPAARPTAIDAIDMLQRIQQKPAKRLRYGLVAVLLLIATSAVFKYINDLKFEREQANMARIQAEQVTNFIASIFKVSNPYLEKAEEVTAADLLARGAQRIKEELSEQPETQALLVATIGDVYHTMGLLDQAKEMIEQAYQQTTAGFSTKSKSTITFMYATLMMDLGEYDQAEKLFLDALDILGDEPSEMALDIKNFLAMIYNRLNQFDKTIGMTDAIIKSFEQHPQFDVNIMLNALNTKGMATQVSGDLAQAEKNYQAGLALVAQSSDVDFSIETNLRGNLAGVFRATGRTDESLELRQKVVEMSEEKLPPNHPDLISNYDNLAVDFYYRDDLEQAKYWNKRSLDVFEALTSENQNQDDNFNYSYSMTLANYGVLLTRSDDLEQAKVVFTQVVESLQKILGHTHTTVADYLYELSSVNFKLGDLQQAEVLADKALEIYSQDEVPFTGRELKTWLIKAEIQNQRQSYKAVDEIEDRVMKQLNEMEPLNQKLMDLAAEKLAKLKKERK